MESSLGSIAIISDIHANLEALTAVLDDIDALGIRRIFCLGDVVGYGPNPKEVIAKIRERNIPAIMGNHDAGLVCRLDVSRFNPYALDALRRNTSEINNEEFDFLDQLPLSHTEEGIQFVHGIPPDDYTTYWQQTGTDVFTKFTSRLCFVGHVHIPWVAFEDEQDEENPFGLEGTFPDANRLFPIHPSKRVLIGVGSVG